MRCRWILLSALLCAAMAFPVSAEYYQYRDKEGNLHFTDNRGQIPEYALDQEKSYDSAKPEKSRPDSAGHNQTRPRKTAVPDPNTWDGQLRIKAQKLSREREKLNRTYKRLQEEKAALQKGSPDDMASEEENAYEGRMQRLNERIERYHQKRLKFQEKVNQFNQQFKKKPSRSSTGEHGSSDT